MDNPIVLGPKETEKIEERSVQRLFERFYETRSQVLRAQIMEMFIPSVTRIVNANFSFGNEEDRIDAIEEGKIGLISAIDMFDPHRGVKFITYLTHRVKGVVLHYLRDNGHEIRRPAWIQELSSQHRNAHDSFVNQMGREPKDNEELALFLDKPPDWFHQLENPALAYLSCLDQPFDDEGSTSLMDQLLDKRAIDPADQAWQSSVMDKLNLLKPLEQKVFRASLAYTQSEIARKLQISPNYVRYLYCKAVTKLRRILGADENVPIVPMTVIGRPGLRTSRRRTTMGKFTRQHRDRPDKGKTRPRVSQPLPNVPRISMSTIKLLSLIWPYLKLEEATEFDERYLSSKIGVEPSSLSALFFSLVQQRIIDVKGEGRGYIKGSDKFVLDGKQDFEDTTNSIRIAPNRTYLLDVIRFSSDPRVLAGANDDFESIATFPAPATVMDAKETLPPVDVIPVEITAAELPTLLFIWPLIVTPVAISRKAIIEKIGCSGIRYDEVLRNLIGGGAIIMEAMDGRSKVLKQGNPWFRISKRAYSRNPFASIEYDVTYNVDLLPTAVKQEILASISIALSVDAEVAPPQSVPEPTVVVLMPDRNRIVTEEISARIEINTALIASNCQQMAILAKVIEYAQSKIEELKTANSQAGADNASMEKTLKIFET